MSRMTKAQALKLLKNAKSKSQLVSIISEYAIDDYPGPVPDLLEQTYLELRRDDELGTRDISLAEGKKDLIWWVKNHPQM